MNQTLFRLCFVSLFLVAALFTIHCGDPIAGTEQQEEQGKQGQEVSTTETPTPEIPTPEQTTPEQTLPEKPENKDSGAPEKPIQQDKTPPSPDEPPADQPVANNNTVRFLHFNDLHANLVPHRDLVTSPQDKTPRVEMRGGIARLATLVKQQRSKATHSVLMNIGDTFHGGVEALYTNGNAIVGPVNMLGIDIGVPGNWDFAFTPQVTRQRYNPSLGGIPGQGGGTVLPVKFKNLAANVTLTLPPASKGKTFLPATHTMTFGTIKVGFIGLTSDMVPRMHRILALGFDFLQGKEAYMKLLQDLSKKLKEQDGVDFVVVMSELGIHKDYALAKSLPAGVINIFFSAHTHEITWVPLKTPNGTLVVEAGNDGYLGIMDVNFDDPKNPKVTWKLLPITSDIKPDPAMKKAVDDARKPFLGGNVNIPLPSPSATVTLKQSIDTVVATIKHPIHRRNCLESPFNNWFTDALRNAAKSQVSMTPGFRFDAVIDPNKENDATLKGKVRLEDLYRFFPVIYTIGTGKIQVSKLKTIIEDALTFVYSPNVFRQNGGWLEGFSGLNMTLNLAAADGKRLTSLKLAGGTTELSDNTVLSAAGCRRPFDDTGVLCSHGGFTEVKDLTNPTTGQPYTVIEMAIKALNDKSATPRKSITDTSQTPAWPQTPFVQPLEGVGKPTSGCQKDDECADPLVCSQGKCQSPPNAQCKSDGDCRFRRKCKRGQCVAP